MKMKEFARRGRRTSLVPLLDPSLHLESKFLYFVTFVMKNDKNWIDVTGGSEYGNPIGFKDGLKPLVP